jgi:hypothetical protein
MRAFVASSSHTTDIDPLNNIDIHITLIVRFRDFIDQQHVAAEVLPRALKNSSSSEVRTCRSTVETELRTSAKAQHRYH